jgi:ferredoxin, 2Fe-2S
MARDDICSRWALDRSGFVMSALREEQQRMGGKNPYIEETKFAPATKKYKVTFVREGKTVEIDPDKIPYGHDGLPGSILDISQGYHMGLDHACGGVCACSTCHVIVHEGLDSCNEATDAELDQLDEAPGVTPKSRLGCQCVPDGTKDIVVEIPEWNKNYAKEAEH